ncbi:paraquat-inducible protein A [Magnetococcales bacterium HHB-1]
MIADSTAPSMRSLRICRCETCGLTCRRLPKTDQKQHCPRCHTTIHTRKPNALSRTWALITAALILYIPANLFPIMTLTYFGRTESSTIVSGVQSLFKAGMWPIALIVLFASVIVPLLKLIVLSFLLISIHKKTLWRLQDRTRLFRITEAVGRWSMIDIFMITILAALVKFQMLSTIEPEIGASFFAAVVILTIFAAHTFDPRLLWDAGVHHEK